MIFIGDTNVKIPWKLHLTCHQVMVQTAFNYAHFVLILKLFIGSCSFFTLHIIVRSLWYLSKIIGQSCSVTLCWVIKVANTYYRFIIIQTSLWFPKRRSQFATTDWLCIDRQCCKINMYSLHLPVMSDSF